MKFLALLITFLMPFNAMSENRSTLDNLSPLLWQNRIILVFSTQPEHQKTILEDAKAQIQDRDIVWFIIDGNQTITNYDGKVSNQFAATISRQFSSIAEPVILIGKDGGVKETSDLLSLESLFDEIDSMPMRIREMQKKSSP